MLLSTLRLPTTLTEVSGQNPPPGIPVPPSDPVPLYGYSANSSQRCNCPSLGTPGTHSRKWVRSNFLGKGRKKRPDSPKVPCRPVRFPEWIAVSRPSRQRMRRTCASGGREEGSAAGSFPFKCGSAHMEPHCAAPRMRGPSAGPGRASSAARPGTKGGGAATPSPSDTPLTPRSPPPPARPRHPGRVRPPARSPTPPPPRPSRPLAPGGPPRPSPRVPPQRSHPLLPACTRCCPVISPPPVPVEPPPLLLTTKGPAASPSRAREVRGNRRGEAGRGHRRSPREGVRMRGVSLGPECLVPGVGEQSSFLPFFPVPQKHPQTSARTHPPRCGTSSGSVLPPPQGDGTARGGDEESSRLGAGGLRGPTSGAGATPRSPGGTGAAEGTLAHRAGLAPLPRLPWQQSPVGLPLPRSA